MQSPPPVLPAGQKAGRRNAVTLKLLFIAGLVLLLQVPLHLVNGLKQERRDNRAHALGIAAQVARVTPPDDVFDSYRMVERSLKHGVLVLALVFTAFFLFEMLAGTGALFAALAAVMYCTRNVDWAAQDAGLGAAAGPEAVK